MPCEAKTCPVCGRENISLMSFDDTFIYCHNCGVSGPFATKKDSTWEGKRINAIFKWNDMPRRLKWTTDKPAEPGFYFWKAEKNEDVRVLEVFTGAEQNDGYTFHLYIQTGTDDSVVRVDDIGGEWAGPIPMPEDR